MGFGILFFGYFLSFLLSLNAYGSIFALVGYYVIFSALQKLSEYKSSLTRCIPFLLLMTVCDLINTVELLFKLDFSAFDTVVSAIQLVSVFLFNLFVFTSISALGKDTDVIEVISLAKTNVFVVSLYFAANLAMIIFPATSYVLAIAMILRLLFPLFALALIYQSFRFICAPEDIDMPIKPSRFKFINNWRERQDKREEETRRMREEQLKQKVSQGQAHYKKHKKKK